MRLAILIGGPTLFIDMYHLVGEVGTFVTFYAGRPRFNPKLGNQTSSFQAPPPWISSSYSNPDVGDVSESSVCIVINSLLRGSASRAKLSC